MRFARVLAGLLVGISIAAAAPPTPTEILKRADAIMAPDEFEAEMTMVSSRGSGGNRTFSLHVWKKGSTLFRVRFSAPPDDAGSEVLRNGDNHWNYLPNLKRSLRISPKQEFHGGDFNNTDILRVNLAEDYNVTLAEDNNPDEYLLDLRAKNESLSYDQIRYWVRKRDFLPLRQEFWTKSGKLIRKLELSEPKTYGKIVRPSRWVMHNMLVPSRKSEMIVNSFSVKQNIDANLFQLSQLGR